MSWGRRIGVDAGQIRREQTHQSLQVCNGVRASCQKSVAPEDRNIQVRSCRSTCEKSDR